MAITVSAADLLRKRGVLEIEITGLRRLRVRLWCAIPFLWLGAKILGSGFALVMSKQSDSVADER